MKDKYNILLADKEDQFQAFVKIFSIIMKGRNEVVQSRIDMQDDMNIMCDQISEQKEQIDILKEALKTHGEIASKELYSP